MAQPDPAGADHENSDYVFEWVVARREGGERVGHGRIDLYKRGHFILEAKQSRQKGGAKAVAGQDDLFAASQNQSGRRSAERPTHLRVRDTNSRV